MKINDDCLDPSLSKEQYCNDPAHAAQLKIQEIMFKGSAKDGRDSSWRDKPRIFYLTKGIRHGMTALMIELGVTPDDGEDHIGQAITRFAMAMTTPRR